MLKHMATAFCLMVSISAHAQATKWEGPNPPGYKPWVVREMPRKIEPSKIILVGDSTTAVIGGWGPSFCAYHVSAFVACVNLARGGRSSRTYMQEGSWDNALNEIRTPGYKNVWVFIQFGHNDQPGNSRSTELAGEFPGYIRRYVEDARAAGAFPVLVTPLTRRTMKNGKIINDLEPWSAAIREVATDMNTPLIDLNALSVAAVEAMGQDKADRFAQLPRGSRPTGQNPPRNSTEVNVQPTVVPRLSFDDTHLGTEGANYFANMVAREAARTVSSMRPFLVIY